MLSAFATFFRRAQEGQFPRLQDRGDLWQLLVTITDARRSIKSATRSGRNAAAVRSAAIRPFWPPSLLADGAGIDQIVGKEPTPEFAAAVTEELHRLLELLRDDVRQIAVLKLEGHTNEQIATIVDRSVPTVERRLRLIRDTWREEHA